MAARGWHRRGHRHSSHSSKTSLRTIHVTKGHTWGAVPSNSDPDGWTGPTDYQPAARRGWGRGGPQPSVLQDEMEASGPVIAVLLMSSLDSPSCGGYLCDKGRWGWHSRFLYHGPSPSAAILSRPSGRASVCPFGTKTANGGESQTLPTRKQEEGGLVRERAGLCWQAVSPQPCPCRPSGRPNSAHRPRSFLRCCGAPISARTLHSVSRSMARAVPAHVRVPPGPACVHYRDVCIYIYIDSI